MEADLKIQATIAVGMLRTVALSSSAFEYIGDALRLVQDVDFIMTSEGVPVNAVERLTSIHRGPAIDSITLACREVAELELLVDAAIVILSRWLEPRQVGLQGLPAAAWRVRVDELSAAVVRAQYLLEQAAASCDRAAGVLNVATLAWPNLPVHLRDAWMKDGRRWLISTRDNLNNARDSLTKACAAAVGARDAAKFCIDLL
ncbi:unnamed protein product [Alopecurus aequalis]